MDIKSLIQSLSQKTSFTPQEAKQFLITFTETIKETVARGESVRVLKLGLFRPKHYRVVFKPTKEGPREKQGPKVVPHFKVGEYLKERISE